jgi:hypothetical protein
MAAPCKMLCSNMSRTGAAAAKHSATSAAKVLGSVLGASACSLAVAARSLSRSGPETSGDAPQSRCI